MILTAIVACEVGFWVLLAAGLALRYVLRWRRASNVVLLTIPLLDILLLAITALHLRSGAAPEATHGLAATYLGFTVAFGHRTIAWADRWFAHRFAGGPRPAKPPAGGRARVVYEWVFWLQLLLAWALAAASLFGLAWLATTPDGASDLRLWALGLARVPAIGVIWPVWWTLFPGSAKPGGGSTLPDAPRSAVRGEQVEERHGVERLRAEHSGARPGAGSE